MTKDEDESTRVEAEHSPIPGLDWRAFHNYVVRALAGDEAVPAAVLAHVDTARDRGETDLAKRDREWWWDFILRQSIVDALQSIDDGLGQLERMAAWYREQAAEMRREMEAIGRRMIERSEFIEEADAAIDGWGANGKLERAKTLEALRKRGVEADARMSDAQIVLLLRQEHQRALEEHARDSRSYGHLDAGQQEFESQARELEEKARAYRQERDEIIHDPDLTEEERARRLKNLQERIEEDVAYQAQEQERSQEAREAQRRESEASRDVAEVPDKMNMLMAFRDAVDASSVAVEADEDLAPDEPANAIVAAPLGSPGSEV